ncbi:MAG: universal stress protein [Chloroflexota bacterium]
MYEKVLVPLDGSEFSECSLAHVKAIAKKFQVAEVVVLHVMDEPTPSSSVYGRAAQELYRSRDGEIRSYLQRVAGDLKAEGIPAQPLVVSGNAAEEILNYVRDNNVDLVIMSTHGRSGVTRWALGSVAERVLRHSPTAVLTSSPKECRIA